MTERGSSFDREEKEKELSNSAGSSIYSEKDQQLIKNRPKVFFSPSIFIYLFIC